MSEKKKIIDGIFGVSTDDEFNKLLIREFEEFVGYYVKVTFERLDWKGKMTTCSRCGGEGEIREGFERMSRMNRQGIECSNCKNAGTDKCDGVKCFGEGGEMHFHYHLFEELK